MLWRVGGWYKRHQAAAAARAKAKPGHTLSPGQVRVALAVLIALIFSKYIYLSSLSSYYTFYLIHKFGVSVQTAQLLCSCSWVRWPPAPSSADRWVTRSAAST